MVDNYAILHLRLMEEGGRRGGGRRWWRRLAQYISFRDDLVPKHQFSWQDPPAL